MTLNDMLQALLGSLETIGVLAKEPRIRLYDVAFAHIGSDVSPNDVAPDEYGCAETLSELIRIALNLRLTSNGGPIVSTALLDKALSASRYFNQVQAPLPGDIIMSPTGSGNGRIKNGHCGVIGRRTAPDGTLYVISNNSSTGTLEVNSSVGAWHRNYADKGGFPVRYYRPITPQLSA